MTKPEKTQARTGSETAPERFLDRHLGNAVHLFLSILAILILVAAAIATVEIIIRDIPMLKRGSVFVYDERNESQLGSPACGCLILAWNNGQCAGVDDALWCGGTYILPGQCARDKSWFTEIENPQVSSHRGLGPKYHITIVQHIFSRVS